MCEEYRSRAPLRLGLGGGGTDVSHYADEYGGEVFNATINLYCHCILKTTSNSRVVFESLDQNSVKEYEAGSFLPFDGQLDLFKAIYNKISKRYSFSDLSFHLITYSDVPSGSGLGGSSTMVVAIIAILAEWLKLPLGEYEMAELAYEIERVDCSIIGGKQDQFAASFGGFNFLEFDQSGSTMVNPLRVKLDVQREYEASMLLYFSGIKREASIIEAEKVNAVSHNMPALDAMHRVKKDAKKLKEYFLLGDIVSFSEVLNDSWESKKKMATSVSNPHLEIVFDIAKANGAMAGKVSGAGGGGFIFFMVNPENKYSLAAALRKHDGKVLSFNFEQEGVVAWKRLS